MTADQVARLEVDAAQLGVLDLGPFQVPYVDLEDSPSVHSRLRAADTEYTYDRSFPVKGHSAVMPAAVQELLDAGKQVLVAERGERYYVYVA